MNSKKILVCVLVAACLASFCACSKSEEETTSTTTETTTIATTQETSESTTTETTTAVITGIPLNEESYVEFDAPVSYTVISECVAYSDTSAQTVAQTYPETAMVVGVATDGNYVILDNGFMVEASNLEVLE